MAPASPLLATKLYLPPARPNRVPRPRLTARLNSSQPLVLIAAPAGFGKTTLLAEWIPTSPHCVTWLSLDEGDNDPARFWQYFIVALHRLSPSLGASALAQLQSLPPPPLTAVVTTLINEIAEFGEALVLVLDDYHLISSQPIHEALTHLLDHLPPNLRLVIGTRADPPLPLPRLRARGQLLELRASDLRFTFGEAAAFLNDNMGLPLSAGDVAALEARTEGWPAGLQLAALSLQGRADTSRFIEAFSGSHRHVLGYLVEEVLARQPEATLQFLLHTAILDRLCAALCEAVTGQPGAQPMLAALEQANLFLVPLDDEGIWFRYHHLFADVLRARLAQTHPGLAPELHRRASEWYAQNGWLSEAVNHALASADLERAAGLIERVAEAMLNRGEQATVQGWLAALPDDLVRTRPGLCLSRSTSLTMEFNFDAAETWLAAAEQPEAGSAIASRALGLRGMIALLRRDAKTGIALTRQALRGLPTEATLQRGRLLMQLGMALLGQGDLAAAHPNLVEASRESEAGGDLGTAVVARVGLGLALHLQGTLRQAAATYREALDLTVRHGLAHMPFVGLAHIRLAAVLYEWNELEAVDRHLQQALQQGERGANLRVQLDAHEMLARLAQARGDLSASQRALDRAVALVHDHHIPMEAVSEISARQVSLWLAGGQLPAGTAWARSCGLGPDDTLDIARAHAHRALARVLLAQREFEPACRLLARMRAGCEAEGQVNGLVAFLTLEAVALSLTGDASQALAAAQRALSLAEPEGYVRVFVDEGRPMQELLLQLRSRPGPTIQPAQVEKLLAAFGPAEAAAAAPPAPLSAGGVPLLEPLRERELEVLRLIAAGYANREIADRLVLGLSTVKTHINHLFQKLHVSSRSQAIARARDLGLLG